MSPTCTHSKGGRRSQASLRNTLVTLEASLRAFDEILSDPDTDALLSQSLHSDQALPDSELLQTSERIVDLLSSIEHRLEPASLRLADYFLGELNNLDGADA